MTIAELLSNEELRRDEFPVVRNEIFLGHAAVCPLPKRVSEAVARFASGCTQGDQEMVLSPTYIAETRQLAAQLIGAGADEIALVGPTSIGLSLIASGLRFRKGDNILIYQEDYPSNVYPWLALAEKGVQVRMMNIRELGKIRFIDVIGQVDENTRLVALASCHFVSGWRLEVEAVGKWLRERHIPFCVDAIQTLGAFPLSASWMDAMAADAHKWLLGPCAAGIMYVRREFQEQIRPTVYGWHNVKSPNFLTADTIEFRKDARRYEAGSANLLGLVGLRASLELILELGVDAIASELLRKRAILIPALQAKGYTVLQPLAAMANASGIVSFHRPGSDMSELHAQLSAKRITTSLRGDRAGNRYVRVSPHFYNTDAEIQQFLDAV
ncbi:MAG: aminotransferase class V-fold PLP-dependent enzyme [Verrucomicrobiales bacterium]|nr:aminotransferase class V-fold PLP-dependent enzyme [Verrucomicrobiales bacterium]